MGKPPRHSQDQISTFLKELNTQTDRGAAIIAAAVLDDLLQILITERCVEMGTARHEALFNKPGAPLSTFSSRIEVSYAIGAISNEVRLICQLIREVRNKFAHRIEQITFDHPEVVEMMKNRGAAFGVNAELPYRAQYLSLFNLIAMMIYGFLRMSDIRIKPLTETHTDQFEIFANQLRIAIRKRLDEKAEPSQD
jgi:hypothetical protein